ncbi:putative tonB-dependent receptor [alpha proteobacterium U9-1i]|nr:putative tonB-dependent receptor [alpha proteobacterium U9-1i]
MNTAEIRALLCKDQPVKRLFLSASAFVAATGVANAQHHGPPPSQTPPPQTRAQANGDDADDSIVVLAPQTDQVRIDRRTYTLREDPAAQTTNMFDVLGRVPSVSVAPSGNITLLGAANVTIQINGQPVPNTNIEQVLRGFTGGDVERIEVITNPSAQYSAQASGGIINIITRQRFNGGFSGSTQVAGDSAGGYFLGFSPSWSGGPWSVGGQLGIFEGEQEQDFRRTRNIFAGPVTTVEQGDQTLGFRGFSLGRLQLGYRPSEDRRMSVSLDLVDVNNDLLRTTDTTSNGAPTSTQTTDNSTHFYNRQVNFEYQQNGEAGETLKASGMVQSHGVEFDQRFAQTPAGGALSAFQALNTVDLIITNSKLDYERRLPGDSLLTLGASLDWSVQELENARTTLAGAPTLPDFISSLDGRQQTLAGYGTLQFGLGDWTLQPGVRIENYRREVESAGLESDTDDPRTFPSVHIRRALTDRINLDLSYTGRVQRPMFNQLDPSLRFTDVNRALSGNANLQPTTTDAYEANFSYQHAGASVSLTFYDRISEDVVSPFTTVTPAGVILTTPVNAGTSEQRGLQAMLRGPLVEGWRYSLTANALVREFDALNAGVLSRRSETEYDGVAQLDYRDRDQNAVGADQLQFELRFQGPRYTLQSDLDEFVVANITWRRRLSPRFFGVMTVQDVFSTQDQSQEIATADYFESSETSSAGARLRLALTYQFGANADRPPPDQQAPPIGPVPGG